MSISCSLMNNQHTNPQILIKTLQIKNNQIDELVRQIKQTQKLHQSLKRKYICDQTALKNRMFELQNAVKQLRQQNTVLKSKYKKACESIEILEGQHEKTSNQWDIALKNVYKQIESHKKQKQELEQTVDKLEQENKRSSNLINNLQQQNSILKKQNEILIQKKVFLNDKINQLQKTLQQYHEKERQYLKKTRNQETKRQNLDHIQDKIKKIMGNI